MAPGALDAGVLVTYLPPWGYPTRCLVGGGDDGVGNVALGVVDQGDYPGPHDAQWRVYDPAGAGQRTFGSDSAVRVFSEPTGFTSVTSWPSVAVQFYGHDGAPTTSYGDPSHAVARFADDPSGGVALSGAEADGAGGWRVWYTRVDKSGVVAFGPAVVATGRDPYGRLPQVTPGVDLTGDVLLLLYFAGNGDGALPPAALGAWLSRGGDVLVPLFPVEAARASGTLHFLAGGGLALRSGGDDAEVASKNDEQWLARFADRGVTADAPPDFRRARPFSRYFVVRGGRGYLIADTHAPGKVELLAADGTSCGFVATPDASGPYAVGRDGTLIAHQASAPAGQACGFRYWPQLLE